jgi:TetR/AcrR family transcriptional regulator
MERRASIRAAARDVFLQHGLHGARSKAIAARAGITEAFMFRHFKSKEEMYAEAIELPLERAFAQLAEQVRDLGKHASGIDFIEGLNRICLQFFIDHAALASVALFAEPSKGRKYYRTVVTPRLDQIRDVIRERAGWNDPRIDSDVLRRVITGAQWAIGFNYELRPGAPDVHQIASQLTNLFTGGIQWGRASAKT